jgi:hypothetical protein
MAHTYDEQTSGWFTADTTKVAAPLSVDTPWEKQAMLDYLQDAEVGHAGAISTRRPLPAHTVKMSGYALADFEADRRQQVLHDRIAELRRRAR